MSEKRAGKRRRTEPDAGDNEAGGLLGVNASNLDPVKLRGLLIIESKALEKQEEEATKALYALQEEEAQLKEILAQLQEEQRLGVEKRDLKRVAEAPANVANERAGPQDDGGAPSEGASPASPASKTPAVDVPTQPTAMPQPAGQLTVAGSAAVGAMGEPTPALVNDTRGGRAVGRVQVEEL